jgi:hypothetical protein
LRVGDFAAIAFNASEAKKVMPIVAESISSDNCKLRREERLSQSDLSWYDNGGANGACARVGTGLKSLGLVAVLLPDCWSTPELWVIGVPCGEPVTISDKSGVVESL